VTTYFPRFILSALVIVIFSGENFLPVTFDPKIQKEPRYGVLFYFQRISSSCFNFYQAS